MSLDLKDIERGVGVDLLRRPLIANVINAALLRSYVEFKEALDEDDDWDESGIRQQKWVKQCLIIGTFLLAHVIFLLGLCETVVWIVVAIVFKLIRLPRIYAFEKLLLDVKVLFRGRQVKHVEKIIQLQCDEECDFQKLTAIREGIGPFVITTIVCDESLTKNTRALLRLIRYQSNWVIAYWQGDYAVMIGFSECVVGAVCNTITNCSTINLGWHVDVAEQTNYKLSIRFTKDRFPQRESDLKVVTRKSVIAEIIGDLTTENLELVVQSMDQFAAVCEAKEKGRRLFNGKRSGIYGIGILISIALIIRYEGLPGLLKPSADVLTLAVGAYTLWMTLGKSAALGETEEVTMFEVSSRSNILMAYHGLAKISHNTENTCWVPEIHHETTDEVIDGPMLDGSISKFEAAVCLSIFEHFGHLLKWKGKKLVLDHFQIGGEGLGHIIAVDRIRHISLLEYGGNAVGVERLGAPDPNKETESILSA